MIKIHKLKSFYSLIENLDAVSYEGLKLLLSYKDEKQAIARAIARKRMGFIPKYLQWNGIIYLIDAKGKYPTGLTDKIISYFEEEEVPFELIDYQKQDFQKEILSNKDNIELRTHQIDALNAVKENKWGMINACTSFGKTKTSIKMCEEIGAYPYLFIVHRLSLLEQTYKEYSNYFNVPIGWLGNGKIDIQKINIASIATICSALKIKHKAEDDEKIKYTPEQLQMVADLLRDCKFLVHDELHHGASGTSQTILKKIKNADYKIGLSVGPQSYVEIIGNIFPNGFVGEIEELWNKISLIYGQKSIQQTEFDYEIITCEDLKMRGWNEEKKEFHWKPLKTIIRHKSNNAKINNFEIGGKANVLQLTDDHSVFLCKNSILQATEAKNVEKNEVFFVDNGKNWDTQNEQEIDLSKIKWKNPERMQITKNLYGITKKDLQVNSKQYYSFKNGKYGNFLPLNMYNNLKMLNGTKIYSQSGNSIFPLNIKLSEFAYLLGFYLGDGWIDKNRITFAVEDGFLQPFIEKLQTINLYGAKWSIRNAKGKSKEVSINSNILSQIFQLFFEGIFKCYEKKIPSTAILTWDYESRKNLLQGLIDSDGYCGNYGNKKRIYYSTTSLDLSKTLLSLLRSIGIKGSLSSKEKSLGGIVDGRQIIGRRESFSVNWSFHSMEKNNKGHFGSRVYIKTNFDSNQTKIKNIFKSTSPLYVYDLESGDNHPSFVADGILVHNSATPFRTDGADILLEASFGPVIYKKSATDLINEGFLTPPKIYFFTYSDSEKTKMYSPNDRKPVYGKVYKDCIVDNEKYNSMIANIAINSASMNRSTLISVKQVIHGKNIMEAFKKYNHEYEVYFLCGKDKPEYIKEMLAKFANKEYLILVSTLIDEGVDIPAIDAVINAGGGASAIKAIQLTGRALRQYPGKKFAYIYDFFHPYSFLSKHSQQRATILEEEKAFRVKKIKYE